MRGLTFARVAAMGGAACLVVAAWAAPAPATASATASAPATAAPRSPHRAVAPHAIAASDWLGEANYLRSFWSSPVPVLTEDPTLSADDLAHDQYLDQTRTCGHSEDPNSPYYTASGAYGGAHAVVYCGALGPKTDVDGWVATPLHGEQVLNPQLTITGFAETSLNGGHAAMDTLTHYTDQPAPTVAVTWPNGTGFPLTTFTGNEIDYTGGDAVVDNCPAAYSQAQALGAPLFVDLPGNAHNAAPTGYALTNTSTGRSMAVCLFNVQSPVSPFLSTASLLPLHPLIRGDSYSGYYTAGGVTGSWSFTVALRAPSAPPQVDVLSSANTEATIGWTQPLNDGGAPVSGYDVQYRTLKASTWTSADPAFLADVATSHTVTGLQNGARYVFRVAALNALGRSPYTVSSRSATPAPSPPDPPTAVVGKAGNRLIHLTWHAPANDGGRPITSYSLMESAGGGGYRMLPGAIAGTSTTLTGLTNGTPYRFEVAATSALGTGRYSSASAARTPDPRRPGVVQLVSARPRHGSAMVSWLRPVSDGGGALTGYAVQYSRNGTAWTGVAHTGTSTTQRITGLTDGARYRFRVAAVNAAGAGPFGSTVPAGTVTPGVSVPPGAHADVYLTHHTSHFGSGVNVDCTVAQAKRPASGVPVAVLTRPAGSQAPWRASAVTRTGRHGHAIFALDPPHDSQLRCRTLGTDQHLAAASGSVRLDVAPTVTLHLSRRTVRHGSSVRVEGRVSPVRAGRAVGLQYRAGRHWRGLGVRTAIAPDGTYATTLTVPGRGRVALRTYRPATPTNAAGTSHAVALTIT